MLYPTVCNSHEVSGEDWTKLGPKIIRTIPGSGLPESGLSESGLPESGLPGGPMYLHTTKCNNQCEIYTQDAVPYKRTLIQAKSH